MLFVTIVIRPDLAGALVNGTSKTGLNKGKHTLDVGPAEVEKVQFQVPCFAGLTLFAERGFYSGHVYQPYVNHRVMDFNSFHDARPMPGGNHGTPLIDSVLRPTDMNSFSLGNKMSFCFYEVEDAEEPEFPLHSPSYLSIERGEDTFLQSCRIKKRNARTLTPETFSKTLAIFSLKRHTDNKAKPVCASEIAMFLQKICTPHIGTTEGLQGLVTEHKLGWLYTVTNEPIPDQLRKFSAALRAVTPMRVAAYDGRHRFNLCCYFAVGYFNPTCRMKLDRKEFGVAFEGLVAKDSKGEDVADPDGNPVMVTFENCAVFQPQIVCVATPKPDVTQSAVFEAMRQQGTVTTAAQGLVVSHTVESMMSEFVEYLGHSTTLVKIDNKNYWRPKDAPLKNSAKANDFDIIDTNTTAIWNAFVTFLDASPAVRKSLLQGNSRVKVVEMVTTFRSGTFLKGTSHCFGYNRVPKPPNGCSTIFAIFGATMKLLCDDIENFDLLRRFLQDRTFKHFQVPSCVEDKAFFGSMEYFNMFVMGIASVSAETVTKRYILEKTLILWALRQKNIPELKADMEAQSDLGDSTWPCFSHCVEAKTTTAMGTIHAALKSGHISDTTMGDLAKKSTKLTMKLKFAAHATLTKDILQTICEYGFNPKVTHIGENNHLLQLYLE